MLHFVLFRNNRNVNISILCHVSIQFHHLGNQCLPMPKSLPLGAYVKFLNVWRATTNSCASISLLSYCLQLLLSLNVLVLFCGDKLSLGAAHVQCSHDTNTNTHKIQNLCPGVIIVQLNDSSKTSLFSSSLSCCFQKRAVFSTKMKKVYRRWGCLIKCVKF